MTHEMTMKAEKMLEIMEQMQALDKQLADYCPEKCDGCPMRKRCLDEGHLDLDYEYDIEIFADYLDHIADVEEQHERESAEAWERANLWAGVDPNWANI